MLPRSLAKELLDANLIAWERSSGGWIPTAATWYHAHRLLSPGQKDCLIRSVTAGMVPIWPEKNGHSSSLSQLATFNALVAIVTQALQLDL